MATNDYRLAATLAFSAMISTAFFFSGAPTALADDPEQPPGQGQDACTPDQGASAEQQQQQQQACAAGIAGRAVGEAKNAADQAARSAEQNDRPPNDLITNSRCVIFNGVPTLIPPEGLTRTASPFDSPMEGKPCWAAYGVSPTH